MFSSESDRYTFQTRVPEMDISYRMASLYFFLPCYTPILSLLGCVDVCWQHVCLISIWNKLPCSQSLLSLLGHSDSNISLSDLYDSSARYDTVLQIKALSLVGFRAISQNRIDDFRRIADTEEFPPQCMTDFEISYLVDAVIGLCVCFDCIEFGI